MLTALLLTGFLGGEGLPALPGPVVVGEERTAVLPITQATDQVAASVPLGAVRWKQHFDPAEHKAYAFDFSLLLASNESIEKIERLRVSSVGVAAGVAIDGEDPFRPIIDEATGKKIQLWFSVEPSLQENTVFSGTGLVVAVTATVTTNSTPPERFERSAALVVRQQ